MFISLFFIFFFKQKTAYEMRISDWSSDVCSSDLADSNFGPPIIGADGATRETARSQRSDQGEFDRRYHVVAPGRSDRRDAVVFARNILNAMIIGAPNTNNKATRLKAVSKAITAPCRSEEHTSELQSLMRISYDVFCLKTKKMNNQTT